MGLHQTEIFELVQRYLKEAHNRDMEIRDLLQQPWHQIIGLSWRAKCHFKHDGWYTSEADVPNPPPDRYYIYVGQGKIMEHYKSYGKWNAQELSEELYK